MLTDQDWHPGAEPGHLGANYVYFLRGGGGRALRIDMAYLLGYDLSWRDNLYHRLALVT